MVKVEIELEDLTNLNHEKNRLNNEYEVLNDIYVTCLNTLKKRNDKLKILEEENETSAKWFIDNREVMARDFMKKL